MVIPEGPNLNLSCQCSLAGPLPLPTLPCGVRPRLKANATQMAQEAEKKATEADEDSKQLVAMSGWWD